jgi:phosphoglycerate dehydrogenase-like enzyme
LTVQLERLSLSVLSAQSDFLAVNCPLNEHTAHMVDEARLATMKPSAYVINTSRGGVVDQVALAAALATGVIAGAAIDVFETEPPRRDDPVFEGRQVPEKVGWLVGWLDGGWLVGWLVKG